MKISEIHYNKEFIEQFAVLPEYIKKKARKAECLFRENPFHPSIRLHKLGGKLKNFWSISLDMKYRIIFKTMDDGIILFISVGTHAIYENG